MACPAMGENEGHQFGVIADCQYCAAPARGVRKYSLSKDKLAACVHDFNTRDLDYVVHLGDFIDRDFKNFDVLLPIYTSLVMPHYHVLGNHDFSVAAELKKEVPQKLGLSSKYYDFEVKGWRYIVLDGNDLSFHAYPKDSDGYAASKSYYAEHANGAPTYNGAIGAEQLAWLRSVLEKATQQNEKVILFCHFPVYPKNAHNLWNDAELIRVFEAFPCVKAYINGHNHKGGYAMKKGIHYLTLKGMVDTEHNAYAVVTVDDVRIHVEGVGREESRTLIIGP